MTLWLYRVLENDEDGDPLDWGCVNAPTLEAAIELVTGRIAETTDADYEYEVGFYEVLTAPYVGGVCNTAERIVRRVAVGSEAPAPVVAASPYADADAAVALLVAARELLKRVGAQRTVERVRLAISSAKGARRHAVSRERRAQS